MKNMPFPHLLEEMTTYYKTEHAKLVYVKCLNAGKIDLAMKIAKKYELREKDQRDDSIIAFGMALMTLKKTKIMTKDELEIIASALQNSKQSLEKEANLFELKNERPEFVHYIKTISIPEIDKAYDIVKNKYYTAPKA